MKRVLGLRRRGSRTGTLQEGGGDEVPEVVRLNVGGATFSTTRATLLGADGSRFEDFFGDDQAQRLPRDSEGRFFIDRDGRYFDLVLTYLRDGSTELPEPGTQAWSALRREAEFYRVHALVDELDDQKEAVPPPLQKTTSAHSIIPPPSKEMSEQERQERQELENIAAQRANLDARQAAIERRLIEGARDGTIDERAKDLLTLELQQVQLEKDRADIVGKTGRELRYNLLIVGVTGTGKSSTLNTLLDSQACQVSGAQAQGTRGCILRDATLDPDHFVSYIDTQGLGADTSISDTDLLSQIMISTESILKMGIINNILISFDVNARTTPAMMANQLTLMELFSELRRSCFLVFTKWNTNSVQVEWNRPLRQWVRKWKRVRSIEEIDEEPPSYEDMYRAFCRYVIDALANEMDGGAFSKMGTFLAFFEARVLFSYNLDAIQIEDQAAGDLDPHIQFLYEFYRNKALDTLDRGSTKIVTNELSFLKEDETTMRTVAARLIQNRDEKIHMLEQVGRESKKRKEMKRIFDHMATDHGSRIKNHDYAAEAAYTNKIAALAGFVRSIATAGCVVM